MALPHVDAVDFRTNEAARPQNLVKKSSQSTEPQCLSEESGKIADHMIDPSSKSTHGVLFLYTLYPLVVAVFVVGVLRFYFREKREGAERVRMQIIDGQDDAISNVQNATEQKENVETVVPEFWIASEMEVKVHGLAAYVQKTSRTANWIFKDDSRASIWALADRAARDELERLSNAISEEAIRSKRDPVAGLFFATVPSSTPEAVDTAPMDAPAILPLADEAEDITSFFVQVSSDNDDGPLKAVTNQKLSEFNPLASTYTILRLSAHSRDNKATAVAKQAMLLTKFKHVSISDNVCSFKLPRLVPIWSDYGVRVCECVGVYVFSSGSKHALRLCMSILFSVRF